MSTWFPFGEGVRHMTPTTDAAGGWAAVLVELWKSWLPQTSVPVATDYRVARGVTDLDTRRASRGATRSVAEV